LVELHRHRSLEKTPIFAVCQFLVLVSDGMQSIWGHVQIYTYICPSWYHCHSLSLAPGNPDWFWFYLSGTGSPG